MKTSLYWTKIAVVTCLGIALVATAGCHKKPRPVINPDMGTSKATTQTAESGTQTELPNVALEDLLWSKAEGLQTVYFDFDSYALKSDALETLKANAEMIKKVPNVIIQLAGHCDERGTQEYNFALSEHRGLAVRDYLMKLGIGGDRMVTISYGKEAPADPGHDEAAWAKNRRVEFNKAAK